MLCSKLLNYKPGFNIKLGCEFFLAITKKIYCNIIFRFLYESYWELLQSLQHIAIGCNIRVKFQYPAKSIKPIV